MRVRIPSRPFGVERQSGSLLALDASGCRFESYSPHMNSCSVVAITLRFGRNNVGSSPARSIGLVGVPISIAGCEPERNGFDSHTEPQS
jgi:hypothetical protein